MMLTPEMVAAIEAAARETLQRLGVEAFRKTSWFPSSRPEPKP